MRKELLSIGVTIVIIAFIGVGVYFLWRSAAHNTTEPSTVATPAVSGTNAGGVNVGSSSAVQQVNTAVQIPVVVDPVKEQRLRARQLATTFVERYGSFSSDSDYANIEDLYLFMTDAFAVSSKQDVRNGRSTATSGGVYFGVITKSLITKEVRYDASAGIAEYLISTQRTTTDSAGATESKQQDISVILQNTDGWKVSGATWF